MFVESSPLWNGWHSTLLRWVLTSVMSSMSYVYSFGAVLLLLQMRGTGCSGVSKLIELFLLTIDYSVPVLGPCFGASERAI